jgi:hypothetical protein
MPRGLPRRLPLRFASLHEFTLARADGTYVRPLGKLARILSSGNVWARRDKACAGSATWDPGPVTGSFTGA